MSKTAVYRLAQVIRLIRFCVKICGTDVTVPNYRMNFITYFLLTWIFLFFVCTGYTMYLHFIERQWVMILKVMSVAGSGAQGLSKLLSCVSKAKLMQDIQNTYVTIYNDYEGRQGDYPKYLHKRINLFWNLMMAFIWVHIGLASIMVLHPLFNFAVYNKMELVLHFVVPGIDASTRTGYIILNSLHISCMFYGAFGNFGGDIYLFLFVINMPLLKDILKLKCVELNELVVHPDRYEEMKAMLLDLLSWHQKYAMILQNTKQIYSVIIFVQLTSSCFNIMCTISCIFMNVWPTAPAFLLYSFIVLYAFCGLGTLVENANEELTDEIYSSCLWYYMPPKEQKLIILMLAKSQKEILLSGLDVLPLSMATGLQLTKGIYSFSMMLITYLDYEK